MTKRKKMFFDDNLENAYEIGNVQRATKGIYCKKRDKTVKSMKSQKTPKERSSDSEKSTCNSRDDMLNRRTDSRVHVHKFHEHDNEEEKNDEAKAKPNSRSIQKEKRMLV